MFQYHKDWKNYVNALTPTPVPSLIYKSIQALQKHQINYNFTWAVYAAVEHMFNDPNACESDLISLGKEMEFREMWEMSHL